MDGNVMRFYEAVSKDGKLKEEFDGIVYGIDAEATDEDEARRALADTIVKLANDQGFDLAVEELLSAMEEPASMGELSESELEVVAGGHDPNCYYLSQFWDDNKGGCNVVSGKVDGCNCIFYGEVGMEHQGGRLF